MRIIKEYKTKEENVYIVKTKLGNLRVGAKDLKRKDAILIAKFEIKDAQKGMTFLEKIFFKTKKEVKQAEGLQIVKAFNLPSWVVKIHPKIFLIYSKLFGLKVVHKQNSVHFVKRGKLVAEQKMKNRFLLGEFKKYERKKSKKN